MPFQLLVSLEAVHQLQGLGRDRRDRTMAKLEELRDFPENLSELVYHESSGRQMHVAVIEGLAVHYWIDHGDRQIKVMRIGRRQA